MSTSTVETTYGKYAYEAFAKSTGVQVEDFYSFDTETQNAWNQAAWSVVSFYTQNFNSFYSNSFGSGVGCSKAA